MQVCTSAPARLPLRPGRRAQRRTPALQRRVIRPGIVASAAGDAPWADWSAEGAPGPGGQPPASDVSGGGAANRAFLSRAKQAMDSEIKEKMDDLQRRLLLAERRLQASRGEIVLSGRALHCTALLLRYSAVQYSAMQCLDEGW